MRALGKYVILNPEPKDPTALLSNDKGPKGKTTVKAVGGEITDIKPGDTVHYRVRKAVPVEIEGQLYFELEYRDLICVED